MTDTCTSFSVDDSDIVAPHAEAMIQSLRAFGYDLPTAVADLIDNSITAEAKHIWIDFFWDGEFSAVSIKDDGRGMPENGLVEAMRLGTQSPLVPRDPRDLGRFGLGLKTASFSQCRRLTVRSKAKGQTVATRCWDLDFVTSEKEWRLLKKARESSAKLLAGLDELESGTIVLWEIIDRLVSGSRVDDEKDHKRFLGQIEEVKNHLSIVFHRFLENSTKLKISINGRPVIPWDPYLRKEKATQELPLEILPFSHDQVRVQPFVLPHQSKIDEVTHSIAAGLKGWNAHQGFYVYRKERLLVAGDWLGLGFQKEEHYKLARIQVDIPNSMDSEWEIDVRKSRARPPASLRADLKRIARLTREKAAAIYRHRGKVIAREVSETHVFPWLRKVKHGKIFYSINRDHPLVSEVLACSPEHRKRLCSLFRMLEETIPVPLIVLDGSENPDKHSVPFEGAPAREIVDIVTEIYGALRKSGLLHREAMARVLSMEPFNFYVELVTEHLEQLEGTP